MSDVEAAKKLFFEGLAAADARDFAAAETRFRDAAALVPNSTPVLVNLAAVLLAQNKNAAALECADRAAAVDDKNIEAHLLAANALENEKRFDALVTRLDRIITLDPKLADAHSNRGNALNKLERWPEALVSYDRALALNPSLAAAWLGRGNALSKTKQYGEALAAYDKALAQNPRLAAAWLGRGNAFNELRRFDEALAAYDRALALEPGLTAAWLARGNIFLRRNQEGDALAAYDKVLASDATSAEAWLGRGNVLAMSNRQQDALAAYERAFAIDPHLDFAESSRLHAKLHLCDWSDLAAATAHLLATTRSDAAASVPFTLLSIPASPADHLQCAKLYRARQPSFPPLPRGAPYAHERIRVAYLSADFRDHPVAYAMAGVLERHDRTRFEVTAIALGAGDQSDIGRRIRKSAERFVEGQSLSDGDIAALMRRNEIDIAVDLNGYTQGFRTDIFALRPAPVQVNYLGYPGTTGAGFIDYILADPTLIPQSQFDFYSERVVWLPDSYMVAEQQAAVPAHAPARRDNGLPQAAFVFCCFNRTYKFAPEMFGVWMRLLDDVAGSVLWLSETNPAAMANLRREGQSRGIAPERLVFAPRVAEKADHVARHRLADLFLDTLPYNAHATASDALNAGLPVLTCLGEAFAGRVGASLLKAAGLSELIATSRDDYEALARELAQDRPRLAALRDRLVRNRDSQPLFDAGRFTRHLESAYAVMHERQRSGAAPSAFAVNPAG